MDETWPIIQASDLKIDELTYEIKLRQLNQDDIPPPLSILGHLQANFVAERSQLGATVHPYGPNPAFDLATEASICLDLAQLRRRYCRTYTQCVAGEGNDATFAKLRQMYSRFRHYYHRCDRLTATELNEETALQIAQQKNWLFELCRSIVQLLTMLSPQDLMDTRYQNATARDDEESVVSSRNESESNADDYIDSREEQPQTGFTTTFGHLNRDPLTPNPSRRNSLPNPVPLQDQSRVHFEPEIPNQFARPKSQPRAPNVPINSRPSHNYQQFVNEQYGRPESPPIQNRFTFSNGVPNRRSTIYNLRPSQFPPPLETVPPQPIHRPVEPAASQRYQRPIEQTREPPFNPTQPRQFQGQSAPQYAQPQRQQSPGRFQNNPPYNPDYGEPVYRDDPNHRESTRYPLHNEYPHHLPGAFPHQLPITDQTSFSSQSNSANTQEQQALRRWFQNKFYDGGYTEDKSHIGTEEFLGAIRSYQFSQRVGDETILRNIGQTCIKKAQKWWMVRQYTIHTIAEFEVRIRARFAPQTKDIESVIEAIHKREQQPGEPLNEYVDDVLGLMLRAPTVWDDCSKIKKLQRGISPEWYNLFVGREFASLSSFLNFCEEITKKDSIKSRRTEPPKRFATPARKVNATTVIENSESEMEESEAETVAPCLSEQEVLAMRKFLKGNSMNRNRDNREKSRTRDDSAKTEPIVHTKGSDQTLVSVVTDQMFQEQDGEGDARCFNCLVYGHQHDACLQPRRIFCYGCGRPEVVYRNCRTCQSKSQSKNGPGRRSSASPTPQPAQ